MKPNRFKLFMDYSKIFGYPHYFHGLKLRDKKHRGSAILSKYPIVRADNYSMDRRVFLRAILDVNGREVNLDAVHPHPELSEGEKAKFFHQVLRDIQKPYILAGDFNAISHQDEYDGERLVKGFRTFIQNPSYVEPTVNAYLESLALKEVTSHDLVDTFKTAKKKWQFTVPTDVLSKQKDSGMRIDYIFVSPDWKVRDAGIIVDDYSEKASDHYPVYAVLDLPIKDIES